MNKFKITRREYNAKSTDYRGTVAGKPYLVYMDDNGGTVYGPVEFIQDPFHLSFDAQYELALRTGNARYGTECRHKTVKNGICTNCLRKVL